jgi:hypothetical protein
LCWFQIWNFSCCVHGFDFGPIFVLGGFSFGFFTRALRPGPHPLRALGFSAVSFPSAAPEARRRHFPLCPFRSAAPPSVPSLPKKPRATVFRCVSSSHLCCQFFRVIPPEAPRLPCSCSSRNRAATVEVPRFSVRSVFRFRLALFLEMRRRLGLVLRAR